MSSCHLIQVPDVPYFTPATLTMHPPLHRPHPNCSHLVQMLIDCHEEHKWGKFLGACNDIKAEMDWCFKEEKEEKRLKNLAKARQFDEAFEKHVAKLELAKQKQAELAGKK
jgi:COX assembly protein 2